MRLFLSYSKNLAKMTTYE
uniref:Uncharacterized protein n=1 Tax=Anguilla anguilla TaxID=7936 RepID=A0A0E9V1Y1_ANGAN